MIINLHSYREQVLSFQTEQRYLELDTSCFLFPGENNNDNIIKFDVMDNKSLECKISTSIYFKDRSMTLKFHTYNTLVNIRLSNIPIESKQCDVSLKDIIHNITHIHINRYNDYILYKNVGDDSEISEISHTECKKIIFQMILDIQYLINKSFYQFRK